MRRQHWIAGITLLLVGLAATGQAQETAAEPSVQDAIFRVDNLWILIAAFLVFIMHPGFALLEAGLTRAKNTVNILFKNFAIVAIGLLTYATVGFSLMYGDTVGGLLGWAGWGIGTDAEGLTSAYGDYTYWSDFLFQAMFAATAATIVSGAVAERVKLPSFLLFSVVYVAVVYPITGHWIWSDGWLGAINDGAWHDFAGSTAVHSVGGWGALAAIILLGPRKGKYVNGKPRPIPGHSMPLATMGVFLLWFGWYGFNGGSVLSADPAAFSLVCVTTSLGSAAGVAGAMAASWIIQRKPDLSMVLNGSLAGLVGITASADVITPMASILIGAIAGVLVVLAVIFIDRVLRLDDPVGATSVHLVCGIWGTLATGIWGEGANFLTQLIGVVACGAFCFTAAFAIILILKVTMGIRVSEEEEMMGLDIGEHGMEAYGGFQVFSTE